MKKFVKGNEAIAETAVRAGCRFFAGYPITPQNEIPEHLSKRMPEVGGVFVQGESEVASSYMVYGAAMTGTRCMTSSSGCGIALYAEGIGYITGAELPVVIVNVGRGGPGLGQILPSQQEYLSATKAPTNGGARCLVLAPATVQEAVDMVYEAFDIADKYRCICYVLADGVIGNMMEGVNYPEMRDINDLPTKDEWRINKRNADGSKRLISSWYNSGEELEAENIKHMKMYEGWKETEVRVEEYMMDDAEIVFAAYGTSARVAKSVIKTLREEGVKAGLIRPKTLFPFPEANFVNLDKNKVKKVICLEMSYPGQMVEDVRALTDKAIPVEHYGRSGGVILKPEDALRAVRKMI
jgi:2-oxoglutarate ferredoxin oxidoreductase subunit alpha